MFISLLVKSEKIKLLVVLLFVLAFVGVLIFIAPLRIDEPLIMVMATEESAKRTINHSFYRRLLESSSMKFEPNGCEETIVHRLTTAGFRVVRKLDRVDLEALDRLKRYFNRYSNTIDRIPNAQASKFAKAVNSDVDLVVVCKVIAKEEPVKKLREMQLEAFANCKVIDARKDMIISAANGSSSLARVGFARADEAGKNAMRAACYSAADKVIATISNRY